MHKISFLGRSKHWFLIFLFTDFVFIFLVYVLAGKFIKYVLAFILLFTLLSLFFASYFEYVRQKREKDLVRKFIFEANFENKNFLIDQMGENWRDLIEEIFYYLREKDLKLDKKDQALNSYREFVEKWTHEIKTPVAISNLLLENHSEEISPYVYDRMKYVQNSIDNDIDKILYYARSNLDHVDYKLKELEIGELLSIVLEKYYPIIAERGIIVREDYENFKILSDENVTIFIISQIMSNSTKYTDDKIEIFSEKKDGKNFLIIQNNGGRVAEEDAPFIFEKGFTSERSNSQKSTGIGLYLSKKYCDDLGLGLGIYKNEGEIFAIYLAFPSLEEEEAKALPKV